MYDGSSSDAYSQEYAIMTTNGPLIDIIPIVATSGSSKQLIVVGSRYSGITSVDYKFTRTILQ